MKRAMTFALLLIVGCSGDIKKASTSNCGNGELDFGEECDPAISPDAPGACPIACDANADSCAVVVLAGSASSCTAACVTGEPACGEGDGCCPSGCGADADEDCTNICGDGVVDGAETCDGDCPTNCDDGDVCTDDSLSGAAEACTAVCVFAPLTAECVNDDGCCPSQCDRSSDNDCLHECGDGVVGGPETCDGNCPTDCDDGDACTIDFIIGERVNCDVACMGVAITQCINDDGCCLPTCDSATDNDCGCDPAVGDCCAADSCMPNEVCNTASGLCEVNYCPGEDPNQCAGNAQRPMWDPIRCFCAECVADNDCPNVGAGETCNAAGNCFLCQTACDAGTPGTCNGGTPYCINECCMACIGPADCAQGELCFDGFCGPPPSCQVDPTVCPTGYTCNQATGECDSLNTGGMACDPTDPNGCPGSFCDPQTSMCGGIGGGLGCGLCNPDCTCDGGLTCDGYYCAGCDIALCLVGTCACVAPVLGCLARDPGGAGVCI